jgi:DNA replication initiation complex subunit (GINS family)
VSDDSMYADADAVLEELETELADACDESETEWREEIDRQNLRRLMDDIEQVQRVRILIREILEGANERT